MSFLNSKIFSWPFTSFRVKVKFLQELNKVLLISTSLFLLSGLPFLYISLLSVISLSMHSPTKIPLFHYCSSPQELLSKETPGLYSLPFLQILLPSSSSLFYTTLLSTSTIPFSPQCFILLHACTTNCDYYIFWSFFPIRTSSMMTRLFNYCCIPSC